ncbi:glycyl-tRNA synthetase beta chain [Sulfurivirga caldicuralii]|uniref:Glycine--tRNA ligase beta subunit n=1 Tax=Sulfurivirga caldicuralii TaxID=364032 RepID=A0A1N6GL54_9GAMM|nr:glycine--tRNA ligase subunit beta [Sulfurivirga caldicuralii]SIO08227.1 glycyl-tRNA synthetase beta chain [Sulfurivirga caldicuralii]
MERKDFLFELGTEELPPKALKRLRDALRDEIVKGVEAAELAFEFAQAYATPRRLAVLLRGLQTQQADREIERRGPAKQAAFDADGKPTKALEGFARSCGVTPDELIEIETPKGVWMGYRLQQPGKPATELLPEIVSTALDRLPIPKRMRWGARDAAFVRPVHWVVMLLGENVVPATILEHEADRATHGHRFHAPQALTLQQPDDYVRVLREQGFVEPDFDLRSAQIAEQVQAKAAEVDAHAVIDGDLLDEVTALNEWPRAIMGSFDAAFLEVPPECLISAMKGHQKYFHVVDSDGKLLNRFITIANIDSKNPDAVRDGNERVIRPRLADARFFWDQDRKQPLEDFLPRLKTVVFQQKLGTLMDKVDRLENLTVKIGRLLGEDTALCERAAHLSKCDLMTEMVGEFPELQGIMGRYYALAQGENPKVVQALDDQYKPRFAGDSLPADGISQALAIADKLDTIAGIYGIGEAPTGDKDPYGLRRAALGALRIIIENELDLDLVELVEAALKQHDAVDYTDALREEIVDFMYSRLRAWYLEQGATPEQFEAVRAVPSRKPIQFARRMDAVRRFSTLEGAEALAAANKRIGNILKKAERVPDSVDESRFEADEERQLWQAFMQLKPQVDAAIEAGDFVAAMEQLATLRPVVDAFFDHVMVNAEDPALRANRLALLAQIKAAFDQIADLSKLSA